jgi:DinB superfamily
MVVLEQPCEECGIDVRGIEAEDLADTLHASVEDWATLLIGPGAKPHLLMKRPEPDTWSAVEYACHVADVIDLMQQRIFLMLSEDTPTFAAFDPDAAALEYAKRSPDQAAALLTGAANRLGDVFATMAPNLWDRTGKRGDGAAFTVLSLSRYMIHDDLHHLWDAHRTN